MNPQFISPLMAGMLNKKAPGVIVPPPPEADDMAFMDGDNFTFMDGTQFDYMNP